MTEKVERLLACCEPFLVLIVVKCEGVEGLLSRFLHLRRDIEIGRNLGRRV